jgi:hypothetical protein
VFFCLLGLPKVYGQDPNDFRTGSIKSRLSIGPVMAYFKNHPQHTVDTKSKVGFCASYKAELLLGRKINFLFGLDYFNQGLSFRGYYAAPGYTYLFDKTFAYTHDIRMHEIQLPIGFKRAFNYEKDNFYTPYFFGGIGARYIFSSYYVIVNDSTENVVYDGKGKLGFEHQIIGKGFNTFFYGGLGSQYNFRTSAKAIFIEVNYKYGISRLHYEGYQNSNNINIKNSYITFSFGIKF